MIEQQDAINKRESKMLHLVNQRQTFGNEKCLKDIRQAKAELAKPDGHVEIAGEGEFGVDFGVIPTADMAMGQFTLLQEAKQEIDQTSVNASLTGSDNRDLSGRAIIAQQSGGQVEITPLMDGKRAWELRIYRQVWARIKQFWTGEKWVRVTDDENNLKWVGLNVPVKRGELLLEQFGFIPPQFQGDPRLNEVVGVKRSVSEMDIDLILEVAPDSITIQQEQFDGLVSLASAGVIFPQETYIKASQLRDKEDLLEQLNGDENAQMQAAQEAEQMKQLQQAGLVAEVEKTASEANENNAEAFKKQMEGLEAQSQIGVF